MTFRSTARLRSAIRVPALALIAGLGLGSAACGQYSISNIRAIKAFKDGNDLYKRQDFKDAAESYKEAFVLNPEFKGIAYFFLANCYDQMYKPSRKGEPENDANLTKAIDYYKMAIDKIKDTDDPGGKAPEVRKRSYEYLIAAYKDKLKDYTLAEPVAKQMIDMDPTDPTNYQVLGALYEDAGRYDEAEALFVKSTTIKATEPQVWSALAGYYERQGKFLKTMDALQKRAEAEPNNPEAWHTMATFYLAQIVKEAKTISKQKALDYAGAGLAADDKALQINAEYAEAIIFKNMLIRVQADREPSAAKKAAMIKEADELKDRGIELQKKQQAAAANAAAQPVKKGGGN